jgi:hypothetical protein
MYKKKYYKCDCNIKCAQEDVLGEATNGINKIKDGRKDILYGLHLICCCCKISEGIRYIERGICKIEKGLNELVNGLRCYEFELDCKNNQNIRNGICGVREALRVLKKGLCQLKNCCLCDGIESIQCGLQILDEALCCLENGMSDVKGERDDCIRGRCC